VVLIGRSLPGLAGPDLKGRSCLDRWDTSIAGLPAVVVRCGPEVGAYTDISIPERKVVVLMGPEWIVVGIIAVVVLFGAKKLPEMARSVGRAQGEFKKGLKDGAVDDDTQPAAETKPEVKPDTPTES
jgi:TatA/E family protein of Tat protein translocase